MEIIVRHGSKLFFLLLIATILGSTLVSLEKKVETRTTIQEIDGNKAVALMKLDAMDIGKINKGMKVRVEWDIYPPQKYGFTTGTVSEIALTPMEQDGQVETLYAVHVQLDIPRDLNILVGLQGSAAIITGEGSMFSQIVNNN
jgi:hypothetical protein